MEVARIDVHGDGPREAVVAVFGEIDLALHDDLQGTLQTAIDIPEVKRIVVDLSGTSFLDSSGISILLRAREAAQNSQIDYVVTGATGIVRQVLQVTGVLEALSGETPPTAAE